MPIVFNKQPDDSLTIPGVDAVSGIRRFANKKDLYLKSLLSYISGLPESFSPYETFFSEENREESLKYIHTFKGVFGNLSITNLYEKTVETEQYVKDGTLTLEQYEDWISLMKKTKSEILAALSDKNSSSTSDLKQGELSDLIKILEALKEPLEFFNSSKCDELLNSIQNKKWNNVSDEFIARLAKNIDSYEYETAFNDIELFIEQRKGV